MVAVNPTYRLNWLSFSRSKQLARKSQLALDTVILSLAFALAYGLRFDFDVPKLEAQRMVYQLPLVLFIQLMLIRLTGIYAFVWRYVGMAEMKAFISGALLAALPLIVLRIALPQQMQAGRIPLSFILMDSMFAFGGVLGMRVMRRALYERR